ncbi:hypothetical protein CEXT_806571 [Caerostris extrusa]|uniref:Uncharacterized protein n=1 Tax=Caerostris extrusa TaxID=172846 RepID=A0AAV4UCG3_CAEEX|nr:hypothetical protein CEXT_806571 [Caerostris extrusa]
MRSQKASSALLNLTMPVDITFVWIFIKVPQTSPGDRSFADDIILYVPRMVRAERGRDFEILSRRHIIRGRGRRTFSGSLSRAALLLRPPPPPFRRLTFFPEDLVINGNHVILVKTFWRALFGWERGVCD